MTAILTIRQLHDLLDVDDAGLAEGSVPTYRVSSNKFEMESVEFDYAQITANASITAVSAATPDTVVTAAAVTYDGSTVVMLEFFCAAVTLGTGNGSLMRLGIWDGVTDLGRVASFGNPTGVPSMVVPVHAMLRVTPSAGAHTFRVVSWMSAGQTGTINAGIGGSSGVMAPAFLRQSRAK